MRKGWQNILLLCLVCLPSSSLLAEKLDKKTADEIIAFSLFNYDNLITDSYNPNKPYLKQLARLVENATGLDQAQALGLLHDEALIRESNPVRYLIIFNDHLKSQTGYYVVDT